MCYQRLIGNEWIDVFILITITNIFFSQNMWPRRLGFSRTSFFPQNPNRPARIPCPRDSLPTGFSAPELRTKTVPPKMHLWLFITRRLWSLTRAFGFRKLEQVGDPTRPHEGHPTISLHVKAETRPQWRKGEWRERGLKWKEEVGLGVRWSGVNRRLG